MNMERELADVVYIFSDPSKPGIKFYDRSPSGAVAEFCGTLKPGRFQTDIYSISPAEWDRDINKFNGSQSIRIIQGSYTAKTIIVSEEQLKKIYDMINNCEDKNRIIIDVGDVKQKNDIDYNLSELYEIKEEFISQMNLNINLNENNYNNENINKNIK